MHNFNQQMDKINKNMSKDNYQQFLEDWSRGLDTEQRLKLPRIQREASVLYREPYRRPCFQQDGAKESSPKLRFNSEDQEVQQINDPIGSGSQESQSFGPMRELGLKRILRDRSAKNKSMEVSSLKSFRDYCSHLTSQLDSNISRNSLAHFDTMPVDADEVRFSQRFKNIKVYQPGVGSLKHGETRKTDSREIHDIVTNRSIMELPKATRGQRISKASSKGAAHQAVAVRKPRSKTTFEWPDASLYGSPGRGSASIQQMVLRQDKLNDRQNQIEPKDHEGAAEQVSRRLPALKLMSPFGEDLAQPYFNHRQTPSRISAIIHDGFCSGLSQSQQQRAQVEHHRALQRKLNHKDAGDPRTRGYNAKLIKPEDLEDPDLRRHYRAWRQALALGSELLDWRSRT